MIDHELMRIPTTKEPPMNHKKKLLATTAAVAVATTTTRNTTAPQPADRLTPGEAPPAWVTLSAGAERVSLCERTLRRAISAGELPGYKIGTALRVRLDELDAWVESKAMPNPRTTRPTLSGGASL